MGFKICNLELEHVTISSFEVRLCPECPKQEVMAYSPTDHVSVSQRTKLVNSGAKIVTLSFRTFLPLLP